ncbi:methylaspartate mutase [Micromonospora rifamycinica]|nr:methylaspartate mutase [Micromonospora rifamycinica]
MSAERISLGRFVARAQQAGLLVVQPRMGLSNPAEMRAGLAATKRARATTVGTITLDSYTRLGEHGSAREAMRSGVPLNGYPIVAHPVATTHAVLHRIRDENFPVQVRHGSALPQDIFAAMVQLGLDATEGGPVSYCLPYGRLPLRESVANWERCCQLLLELEEQGAEPHLETFGGCMMGQLCPPSLLVAISVLEALFFYQQGLRSVSLSYAQQANAQQDEHALLALHRLAAEFVPHDADRHIVLYAYMGVYPRTEQGARRLLCEAARLASRTPVARLIVKTAAEAHRIPTVTENVTALELAGDVASERHYRVPPAAGTDTEVYAEASTLVNAVLELSTDVGQALRQAFSLGILDVPYCLHPDNAGLSRSYLAADGWLRWAGVGRMPLAGAADSQNSRRIGSTELLAHLSYVARRFDSGALGRASVPEVSGG